MSNSELHDKFDAWLTHLQGTHQPSIESSSSQDNVGLDVVKAIKAALIADAEQLPDWIGKRSSLSDTLVSTADDLKSSLKRLCLPAIASRFNELKADLAQCHDDFSSVDCGPEEKTSDISAKEFLSSKLGHTNAVAALVKMADYGCRLDIVNRKDAFKLDSLIARETRRLTKFDKDLTSCRDSERYYEGLDESGVLHQTIALSNDKLHSLEDNLNDALAEEDIARKAYELALQRTQIARKQVTHFESFVSLLGTQSEIMKNVNKLRIAIADYNKQSADRRLKMLASLKDFVLLNTRKFVDVGILADCESLFQHLAGQFLQLGEKFQELDQSSTDAATVDSLLLIVRVGLETLRVWHSLGADQVYESIASSVDGLETFLRNALEQLLQLPITRDAQIVDEANQTVVLYFDHVFHDTPEDHVENQARVATSLKLVKRRISSNEQSSSMPCRTIVLRNCDDILAPPSWCLPLVHSPQYLSHLAELAAEAKSDDLFVPLEFDTEWESDEESVQSEEEDTVKRRRRRCNVKSKRLSHVFDMNQEVACRLGPTAAQKVRHLLTPHKVDIALASTLRADSLSTSRRRNGDDDMSNRIKSVPSMRVQTPYGTGLLLTNSAEQSENSMVKVRLDWGAIAHLQVGIVQLIERKGRQSKEIIDDAPPLTDTSTRFLHTDLKLHKRFRRILDNVRMQRQLLEKVGVKDAILSLWLHGRTSAGVTANVESGIKLWLKKFDLQKVDELLDSREQRTSADGTGNNIFEDLEQLRLPILPAVYIEPVKTEAVGNGPVTDNYDAMREEALKYSLGRITKKSGDVRNSYARKPREPSGREHRSGDGRTTRKKVWGRTHEAPESVLQTPKVARMGELLRILMYALTATLNMNQTNFVQDVIRRYGCRMSQTSVSAWVRYKASHDVTNSYNKHIFDWVVFHRKLLAAENQAMMDELIALREGMSGRSATKSLDNVTPAATVAPMEDDGGDDMEEDDGDLREDAEVEIEELDKDEKVATKASFEVKPIPHPSTSDATLESSSTPLQSTEEEVVNGSGAITAKLDGPALHEAVMREVARRHLTHSYAAQEATRLSYRLTQPMLSKFSKEGVLAATSKARMVRASLINWLNYSRLRPVTTKDENSFCSSCGKSKFSFPNQHQFLGHVGTCGKTHTDHTIPAGMVLVADDDLAACRKGPGPGRRRKKAEVVENDDDEDNDSLRSVSGDDSEGDDGDDGTAHYEALLDAGTISALSDSFNLAEPYEECSLCKQPVGEDDGDSALFCTSCPCVYHIKCLAEAKHDNGMDEDEWHCTACRNSGSAHAVEMVSEEQKVKFCVPNASVFVYAHEPRIWRKATVVRLHSSNPLLMLVRWQSAEDNVLQWVDMKHASLLKGKGSPDAPARGRKRQRSSEGGAATKRSRKSASHADVADDVEEAEPDRRGKSGRRPSRRRRSNRMPDMESTIKSSSAGDGMTDTYVASQSLQAALCAAGTACRAVDIVMTQSNSNAFVCTRPPGHHAGRYGCTRGCLSTGFCLLNNAAIALTYARVRYGLRKIAVVDIDVHFGNGTAEILRSDPQAFFASVHMVYGCHNDGHMEATRVGDDVFGFYPAFLGKSEIADNYVSVGVQPANMKDVVERHSRMRRSSRAADEDNESEEEGDAAPGSEAEDDASIMSLQEEPVAETEKSGGSGDTFIGPAGYLRALRDVIIPKMEEFAPELLIISAGFDGYLSDPLGNELKLTLDHYTESTLMLVASMDKLARQSGRAHGRVVSLLEGGYDTSPFSLGLARCVDTHVAALQQLQHAPEAADEMQL